MKIRKKMNRLFIIIMFLVLGASFTVLFIIFDKAVLGAACLITSFCVSAFVCDLDE